MNRLKINFQKSIPVENKLKQLDDICSHKKILFEISTELSKYFFKINKDDLALKIMERCFIHDISKIEKDEFYGMSKFVNDMGALKDPKVKISEDKLAFIELHRSRNKHHPEYWDNFNNIEEIDIIELCCDWCSRSMQFNTNPIDFLEEKQGTQFNFPEEVYNKIEYYLELIMTLV